MMILFIINPGPFFEVSQTFRTISTFAVLYLLYHARHSFSPASEKGAMYGCTTKPGCYVVA